MLLSTLPAIEFRLGTRVFALMPWTRTTEQEWKASVPASLATTYVDQALPRADDGHLRSALIRLLEVDTWEQGQRSTAELRAMLLRYLEQGTILLVARGTWQAPALANRPQPQAQPAPEPVSEQEENNCWIEVEVVDEEGQPYAGATVRVYHQGHVVATKQTSGDPFVRFEGLPEAGQFDVEVEAR